MTTAIRKDWERGQEGHRFFAGCSLHETVEQAEEYVNGYLEYKVREWMLDNPGYTRKDLGNRIYDFALIENRSPHTRKAYRVEVPEKIYQQVISSEKGIYLPNYKAEEVLKND